MFFRADQSAAADLDSVADAVADAVAIAVVFDIQLAAADYEAPSVLS